MRYFKSKVISQEEIAPQIYLLELSLPDMQADPGQFFMLKSWDDSLPLMRPLSIFKISPSSVSFLYRVIGKGTEFLSRLGKNDDIQLLGPLGKGFPCSDVNGKIALVGGGLGIPPLYETAKKLKEQKKSVDLYLGYKSGLFIMEDFIEVCDRIFIATEEGKEGYKGFVTDLLECRHYDAVFTCGPEPMMFKVVKTCREHHIPVWLSLEKRMGCGIGACLVCSCETESGMQRSCKDGPVFDGYQVVIEE